MSGSPITRRDLRKLQRQPLAIVNVLGFRLGVWVVNRQRLLNVYTIVRSLLNRLLSAMCPSTMEKMYKTEVILPGKVCVGGVSFEAVGQASGVT